MKAIRRDLGDPRSVILSKFPTQFPRHETCPLPLCTSKRFRSHLSHQFSGGHNVLKLPCSWDGYGSPPGRVIVPFPALQRHGAGYRYDLTDQRGAMRVISNAELFVSMLLSMARWLSRHHGLSPSMSITLTMWKHISYQLIWLGGTSIDCHELSYVSD